MDKNQEIQIQEVIAHALFRSESPSDNRSSGWRSDPDVREDYRGQASNLLSVMQDAGIRVSVKSSKQLEDSVENIVTEPAVKAYALEEVVDQA